MRELLFHTNAQKGVTDDLKSVSLHFLSKVVFLTTLFFLFLSNAQIYVSGSAQMVGKEYISTGEKKIETIANRSAVIYITEGASVTNYGQLVIVKKLQNTPHQAKIAMRKSVNFKKQVAVQEKLSQSKKIINSKKRIIHYKPFDNPDRFMGSKHYFKTFNLPSEHPSKVVEVTQHLALRLKDFSLQKTKILSVDFFNKHTFYSVFYTRPPPFKV
ncbi:hypothetical protein [Chryseobacterium foetidum]|uniref:hypothetical protein n=1 Tax=Chryseobacterium foetidum TaxID=2951057 RepID=UPI0021C64887|nr:hypothetical protein [Chryseobacterium foetidum]